MTCPDEVQPKARVRIKRCDILKDAVLFLPVDVVRSTRLNFVVSVVPVELPQQNQLLRFLIGKRAKQDGVHYGENGAVRTNSQGQAHYRLGPARALDRLPGQGSGAPLQHVGVPEGRRSGRGPG